MDLLTRASNAFKALTTNSLSEGQIAARRFRNRGNTMYPDWSYTFMEEPDKYKGFLYSAINNRANKVVTLAHKELYTTADQKLMDEAKKKEEQLTHPYLKLINESESFANNEFWYNISTYLDLKGRYYLMAVRNKAGELNGEIQYFKLLNPYNVRRVINQTTRELIGYAEEKDGLVREIPPHMIIEFEQLNPFDDEPYSMSDAAKDPQFSLKTSSDHTRHSVAKNRATSGIVVVNDDEIELDPQKAKNFQNRVKGKEKGEPIFATGKGKISWEDMQIDLNKSALDKVVEVNLKELIAVSGNSKTMMGIEESGVTRDTSGDQKDLFVSNHVVPQLQRIIDRLNQDYKNNYRKEWEKNRYTLEVNDPSETNLDAEIKEQELRDAQLATYQSMRNKGYTHEIAAKYAEGRMELAEIGEPTEEPKQPEVPDPKEEEPEEADNHFQSIHNLFEENESGLLTAQQGALENAVRAAEEQTTLAVLNKVTKNDYNEDSDIITESERKRIERELDTSLEAFYLVLLPLFARRMMNRRQKEFGLNAVFSMNREVKSYVGKVSSKAAQSHMNTILDDLLRATREAAASGASQQELINAIRSKYNEISLNRAKAIARTETNRAFTQSQFHADKQFLKQNKLENRAFKKWITTSDNPCALCQEMASRPPVKFKEDFLDFGSELVVTYQENDKTKVLTQKIDYEPLEAGNLHVNCGCKYQLIVE